MRLWTVVLELSVVMAQFPSREIAQLSFDYRTLGLGYANIGGYLMSSGIAYDSDEGRAICGALSAIMTGVCYATSAEMARERGAFVCFGDNREAMLRVMRNHRRAAHGRGRRLRGAGRRARAARHLGAAGSERLPSTPAPPGTRRSRSARQHGYRNAQVSVVAPTGTIGLVMDCDTTGIEPDFALVKFKKLAGGGYFKIINRAVPEALARARLPRGGAGRDRGLSPSATPRCARRRRSTTSTPADQGLHGRRSSRRSRRRWPRPSTSSSSSTSGRSAPTICATCSRCRPSKLDDPAFDLLTWLGFSKADIEAANIHVCGAMTVEGAPHLKHEHYPVFDCANACGRTGKRYLSARRATSA